MNDRNTRIAPQRGESRFKAGFIGDLSKKSASPKLPPKSSEPTPHNYPPAMTNGLVGSGGKIVIEPHSINLPQALKGSYPNDLSENEQVITQRSVDRERVDGDEAIVSRTYGNGYYDIVAKPPIRIPGWACYEDALEEPHLIGVVIGDAREYESKRGKKGSLLSIKIAEELQPLLKQWKSASNRKEDPKYADSLTIFDESNSSYLAKAVDGMDVLIVKRKTSRRYALALAPKIFGKRWPRSTLRKPDESWKDIDLLEVERKGGHLTSS